MRSVFRGKALPDGCCSRVASGKAAGRMQAQVRVLLMSDVASRWAASRPAVLFTTSERTDVSSRGRGGGCEIHPHTVGSGGKSLRFLCGMAVGRYFFNRMLKQFSVTGQRARGAGLINTSISLSRYPGLPRSVRPPGILSTLNNAIWRAHKSSLR